MIAVLSGGRQPVVAVGGIFDAGAALVQVYTGLVYRGPAPVRTILIGLSG
jgi:dihydroorotate dehydrogenase